MKADAALRAIVSPEPQPFTFPRELITTDRVLQRWAVSIGWGLPTEEWDDTPKAKPPPLSDDVAIVVDQLVLRSPPKTKALIVRWYKTPQPVEVIAQKIGVSPRKVHRAHAVCLYYLRDRFESSGNRELCKLIRMIDA